MKQLVGWRALATRGFACAAAALAIAFLIRQVREAFPPREVPTALQPIPVAKPPDGPAMAIDSGERARAGRERRDNGLEMSFCWCPPGSFHMGRLPDRFRRLQEIDPVRVTLRSGF